MKRYWVVFCEAPEVHGWVSEPIATVERAEAKQSEMNHFSGCDYGHGIMEVEEE